MELSKEWSMQGDQLLKIRRRPGRTPRSWGDSEYVQ